MEDYDEEDWSHIDFLSTPEGETLMVAHIVELRTPTYVRHVNARTLDEARLKVGREEWNTKTHARIGHIDQLISSPQNN